MLRTFCISFKIRNAYLVNEIIYSLSKLPFLGKHFFQKFEGNKVLKFFSLILSVFFEITKPLFINLFYIFIFIFLISQKNSNYFLQIYFFLSLAGMIINTYLFNPSKDKYYAIYNLRMNVKEYVLSNYIEEMIKIYLGSILWIILFSGLKIKSSIFLPLFVISIKTFYNVIHIYYNSKYNKMQNENKLSTTRWIFIIIFILIAYIFPILSIQINYNILIFIMYLIIFTLPYTFYKLYSFKEYKKVYKKLLTRDNIIFDVNQYSNDNTIKLVQSQLNNIEVETNKKGMAYLNEIFTKRHKKLLINSTIISTLIIITIFISAIIIQLFDTSLRSEIGEIPLNYLPYFMFIMYIVNRGENVTRAYFMNCDHSMLNYNFFKIPKNIVILFKERLITLTKINLIPAFFISLGLNSILLISGVNNNNLYYLLIPITIFCMSILFSTHYLILYYLLQPYNLESKMVGSTYRLISSATYLFIYMILDLKISTLIFGSILIIFTLIYIIIGLQVVYKRAYKTFRIK